MLTSRVIGAFFGTTFAPLLFQTYRELAPAPFCPANIPLLANSSRSSTDSPSGSNHGFINPNQHGGQKLPSGKLYVPRIFGFRVSERSRSGPRMRWLRVRPETAEELELVDYRGRWKIPDHDDGYDDDDDDEEDGRMENFDDDDFDDDEEEEEEEEEEEDARHVQPPTHAIHKGVGRRLAMEGSDPLEPCQPSLIHTISSDDTSTTLDTIDELELDPHSVAQLPRALNSKGVGKLVVRQNVTLVERQENMIRWMAV